ncbi:MAG: methyltransferase [Eubacteriales bacterium]
MEKQQKKQSEHYYTQSPTSDFKTYNLVYNAGRHSIRLKTADGVFSKHAVDFGSNLLINTIAKEAAPKSVLDIGCGYGVVGISLSKIFGCHALMCDINQRAVELAKENAQQADVEVLQSDGFENVEGTFDMIVTNPPIRAGKDVYYKWFDESINYLNEGGRFYCVIQKKQGAPSAMKHLEEIYGECHAIAKDKGYYIIKCDKK